MFQELSTNLGPVTIRPAVPGDAGPLRELRLEALANEPTAFGADYAATSADSNEFWAERIRQYRGVTSGLICLAVAGDEFIGMTGLVRGHWPKTRHSGSIWGVYVNPDWRGLGVGKALIDGCLDWAREQRLSVVKLAVVTRNMAAIRCYTATGFSAYGLEPKAIRYNGVDYDELLMARTIGSADPSSATG